MSSKTLLQQNPLVLNWGCQLMQVVLYNGHEVVVIVNSDCNINFTLR